MRSVTCSARHCSPSERQGGGAAMGLGEGDVWGRGTSRCNIYLGPGSQGRAAAGTARREARNAGTIPDGGRSAMRVTSMAAAAGLALILAACGGGDKSGTTQGAAKPADSAAAGQA